MESSKPQGTGSIWNINSWHWENKNYTEPAKKLLTQKLLNLVYQEGEIKISHTKLNSIKGDAQVNIRKGKQILCYEFNIQVSFKASNGSEEIEGEYKINDVNESDMDFQIASIAVFKKSAINDKVKEILRKKIKKFLEDEIFKNFNEQLYQFEADPEKLKEDQKKREEAAEKTQKAKEETSALKEQIFLEQQEKEKQIK
eukprot:TRINITY_DN1117_c0_g1_i6.p1 TRINITY_DN1117_c0_g1~~TRINITY_DN1117_c0_g1_i6.p1  ORF type:complete len:199 (-),score=61.82 TRINITY_DN1117_c0_g1_i6:42-638(-)